MSWHHWALLAIMCCTGCTPAASSAALVGLSGGLTITDIEASLSGPLTPALIATVNQLKIGSLYQALARDTDDAPFRIAGRVMRGMHSRLVAAAPEFAAMNARYASLGEQMAASAIDMNASRPAAEIASDLITAVDELATTRRAVPMLLTPRR